MQKVPALIPRRPAAIVLDVAGLLPVDETCVLIPPGVALDAAEDGVAVALATPSPPWRDRPAQLGVRDLTVINSPVTTAPTEEEHEQENRPPRLARSDRFRGEDASDRVQAPARPCGRRHRRRRPAQFRGPSAHVVTASAGGREPASVVAARQLVDDAHSARTQAPRRPRRASAAPSPVISADAHPAVGLAEDSNRSAPNTGREGAA